MEQRKSISENICDLSKRLGLPILVIILFYMVLAFIDSYIDGYDIYGSLAVSFLLLVFIVASFAIEKIGGFPQISSLFRIPMEIVFAILIGIIIALVYKVNYSILPLSIAPHLSNLIAFFLILSLISIMMSIQFRLVNKSTIILELLLIGIALPVLVGYVTIGLLNGDNTLGIFSAIGVYVLVAILLIIIQILTNIVAKLFKFE